MKNFKLVVTFLLGFLMIMGGIGHFRNPALISGFIPDFLPKDFVNYASGILEIALGIAAFIPSFRAKATWGIFILMILFLPIHIIDLFREQPVIGSHQAAIIRVPFQFLFILMGWFANKKQETNSEIN